MAASADDDQARIDGTHWRALAVPSGMSFAPQFGFQGAEDPDFSESVICTDEEEQPRETARHYADRQMNRLKLFAPDLETSSLAAPRELLKGDHAVIEASFTHDRRPVRQMHAFVRSNGRIGTVVWTYRDANAGDRDRFWEIISALRLD